MQTLSETRVKTVDSVQQLELSSREVNMYEQINDPWRGSQNDKVDSKLREYLRQRVPPVKTGVYVIGKKNRGDAELSRA